MECRINPASDTHAVERNISASIDLDTQSIVSLFEEQVCLHPKKAALVFEEQTLSYEELNRRAGLLAGKLHALGIGHADFVAINMQRGVEMIVALYAVLKSGAAYVPVDPSYPAERVAYILQDCGAKAVLTNGSQIHAPCTVIDVSKSDCLTGEPYSAPCQPEDLAYLIYTSGTTGKPKGVMISHRNVVNYCYQGGQGVLRFAAEQSLESILGITNFVFDIFVTEAILSLLNGMTLVLANEEEQSHVNVFSALIERYHPHVLQTTPGRIRMFLAQNPSAEAFRTLRYVMLGGEAVTDELLERLRPLCPNAVIVNVYGPSETTVWSTCADVSTGRSHIGEPISNTSVYVLNGTELCAEGEIGELCIAGEGVSLGYWNRPELAAQKFIPNPFGEGKLYRSGDLARRNADGTLDCLGRVDDQVKIRGNRVELLEIDAAFRSLPQIQDCAIIAREDVYGQKQLYGYCVSKEALDFAALREQLRVQLPEFMIPTFLLQIPSIPLNANGKVDRSALPAIEQCRENYAEARNEIEQLICDMFSAVLEQSPIGREDDFFAFGGHSLSCAVLLQRMQTVFGCRFTQKDIFANPTPAMLALLVDRNEARIVQTLPKAEQKAYYPLSFAQSRIYLSCMMQENTTNYNLPELLHLHGELDYERLFSAFQTLLDRHEALRTQFVYIDGEPMQQILPSVEAAPEMIDDCISSEDALTKDFVRPFDLSQAPLVRMRLIRRDSCHLLMLDMHHIISDGMSVELFWKEMFALYHGQALPQLSYQYKDYSEAERCRSLDLHEQFWMEQFRDEVPVLELPLDFARKSKRSFSGEILRHNCSAEFADGLRSLAERYHVTEYMVFLSAAMILLSKYGRQEDLVIGSAFSGRDESQTQNMLGMFVSTLALRAKPHPTLSYPEFLAMIKDLSLNALEHQSYPFEALVQALKLERAPTRNPLFDVMLVVHTQAQAELGSDALSVSRKTIDMGVARFDLTFQVERSTEGYEISIEYATELFRRDSVQGMLHHYIDLLQQLCSDSSRLLKDYCLYSPQDRHLLKKFNATKLPYAADATIVSLFDRQAIRHSGQVAIVHKEKNISYQALNEKANALAFRLQGMGIEKGMLVALYANSSIEAFIGILGILKVGAAYLPVDPSYPTDRTQFILSDSGAQAVLTHESSLDTTLPTLSLDDALLWNGRADGPAVEINPEDLAYCIYTSGTTGRPKGVLVEHRGIANLKAYFIHRFQITSDDRVLQFANLVFDASVWEWTMALLNGAQLVLCSARTEIAAFEAEFCEKGITVATLPPNFYAQLGRIQPRLLITAGSAADQSILEKSQGIRYVNAYGPTETTICATAWERVEGSVRAPIGSPISNTEVYILQGTGLCGIGVPGELCVSGVGVARGYLNRPELTEERFVPNPFGEGKLYRTGDLARWLPDGNLEFLGRIDEQVKIRGFRVEPAEVEVCLRRISGVLDCSVIVRKDAGGEQALFAYLVSDSQLDMEQIKVALRRTLPEYMIPSYLMQLEQIPVTKSGKVDKRALPDITRHSEAVYVAPRNETEQTLCDLFQELLGVAPVSVTDNFFTLGGHSLRAVKLVNRINEVFGIHISMAELFADKTPQALAERIATKSDVRYQSIPKTAKKDSYPMSAAQKRMYLVQQMEPNGISYNLPLFWHLEGDVHPEVFRTALQAMLDRHEILRTSFHLINGEAIQTVHDNVTADFLCREEDADSVESFVRPFELSRAPLVRMELVKCAEHWLLMLDMHHIIADGMSAEIFCREFAALLDGQSLPAPMLQYRDYSEWMRSRNLSAQAEFWKKQLSDAPTLELPLDFTRPKEQSFRGASVSMALSEELCQNITALTHRTNATDYMVFLSAAMILLSKYSRQEDIVIGSAFSGRTHADVQQMLGMFVSTLALRAYPEANKTYSDFLTEIRNLCMQAYENQEYPFEELIDSLGIERNASRNPLFDVMLVMQNQEEAVLSGSHFEAKALAAQARIAKFDLTFSLTPTKNGYQVELEYCTDLFRRETARRFLGHYAAILQQILSAPNQRISQISTITEEEERKILHEFNQSDADYPRNRTLVDLFEAQVRRTPERIAVSFEGRSLTYAELNAAANRLAHRLRKLGVHRESLVPLYIERGLEMIIGIYGILKAGGAYVPINTMYPVDRVEYILQDSQAQLLLLGNTALPLPSPCQTLQLCTADLTEESAENCTHVNCPEDIAYVIYTSGTTGNPKGVMVEHRNVVRLMVNSRFQFDFDESDVWMMFHSYGFDFSVWEMYGATLLGGRLVVVPEETARDSAALRELIKVEGVTVLNQVPSSFYNLQRCCDGSERFAVRYLIFGGEALYPSKLQSWHSWYPDCKIINMYGITETTVHVTYREIGETEIRAGISDIGNAIPTLKVYIMNGDTLCGIGVPGELCVAGAGLARGYLHAPELTALKFVNHPFGEGRLYRSGDLARWLPNGNLEYLGRIDEQVKIRGFRIELGEIDSVLRSCPEVKDCAVIVRKDAGGDNAIYAYVVSDVSVDTVGLRQAMGSFLPQYMIPAYMMQIDTLPLTRNGKLDRKALPQISSTDKQHYAAPRNQTESLICKVFAEILGLSSVGINDSFFELGGHSLRAVQLANRLEGELRCNVSLKDVFASSTPAALAELIEGKTQLAEALPLASEQEFYPMSAAQRRMYLVCQMDSGGISYNMPQAFRISGELNVAALQAAFQALVDRHAILRTQFRLINGEPVQQVLPYVKADFLCIEDAESTEDAWTASIMQPFDLSKAPLQRIRLIRRRRDYLLLIDTHHIISDGISAQLLREELSSLYQGITLPELRVQYKDYSEWMRSRDMSKQREYWVEQFTDEIPVLDLPLDHARPQEQSFRGALCTHKFAADMSAAMKKFAKQHQVTDYMLFLSAAMVLLSKYSRQEDLVIGSAISGRTHRDTRDMQGMFVNTLALRAKPEGNKPYLQFLHEVKQSCLNAYENQDYPFEELVDAVRIERDLSRNPLFDVMLVMQNTEEQPLRLQGVQVQELGVQDTVAKFDLSYQIQDVEDCFVLSLEYCTALFEEDTAQRMLRHYEAILRQILDNPEKALSELMTVTEIEREQILSEFNETTVPYPKRTLMELLEERVAAHPKKTALVFGDASLSYAELNARINRLAWTLRENGVQRGDLVAILPKRSLQTVIGICAILKAGAAYVPIDPSYPKQRIAGILDDCCPKLVLTYEAGVETALPVLDLTQEETWSTQAQNPPKVNEPEDVAYCIYTSGTTGKPKGVLIRHHSILNLVMNCDYMPFTEETNTIQTGQLVFDASTFEIWGTLLNGGCLHIISEDLLLDAVGFGRYLREQKINMQFITTALFNQFVSFDPTMFDGLHCVSFGGERVSEEHVKLLLQRNPKLRLTNCYGPTESTTIALRHTIAPEQTTNIPIGSPIHNTQIYILQGMELCGIGVPGELCIAGVGLAKGYLNRPELTEEKFIENPFGEGKLYRSGDLARWLPNGTVEFMGRIDEQVKIRGFRIELAEIENVLRRVDGVQDCAVIVRKDAICAYVVGERALNLQALREAMQETLPEYMLPGAMVQLERIPLTKNGKLDKRALPEIEMSSNTEYAAPRDETEQQLLQAFIKVLGVESLGIHDNFFENGGHSLKTAQLVNLLRGQITIKEVFELKTVAKLAERIRGAAYEEEEPGIEETAQAESYPMSEAQKRLYIFEQMDETKASYHVTSCFALQGSFDIQKAEEAFRKLILRHESLRTSFAMQSGVFVQIVHENAAFSIESISMEGRSLTQCVQDFLKPYDLSKPELFRGAIAENAEGKRWLLLDFHHIIIDGFSVDLLLREFALLYAGKSLPENRLQYRDYTAWMQKRDLSKQKAYWNDIFAEPLPEADLPLDFKRREDASHEGALVETQIAEVKQQEIEAFCKRYDVTPYAFFTAVLSAYLGRLYDTEDVCLGMPVSGRSHRDTENIVGMLVNTLALRSKPEGKKTFVQFLGEIKQSMLEVLEHQDYPFNRLTEELPTRRSAGRGAAFDVFFNYFDTNAMESLTGEGFTATEEEINIGAGKFDLVFDLVLRNGGYHLISNYKPSLLKEESVKRFHKQLITLLHSLLTVPEQPLAKAELLTAEERKQLLQDFQSEADYDRSKTFVELLRETAQRLPHQTALVSRKERLRYEELDEQTDTIAKSLIERGIQRGEVIGVMAQPGFATFLGAIGVMKAGAAYMPIDPLYPEGRIDYMLQHSRCRLVLTDRERSLAGNVHSVPVSQMQGGEAELPKLEGTDAAYVIYTSGSTGTPKGVLVEHGSLANLIFWHNAYYEITEKDQSTKYAGFGFDASVHEMYPQLAAGATIHIIPEEMRMDLPAIGRYMEENKINIGFFPTPVCEQFSKLKVNCLEKVITGGDKLKTHSESYTIYNNYGPTEGTVLSTAFKVDRPYENIPIGKPISNVKVYIVNRHGQLQPIGLPGELWLGGRGLARGYLYDEKRTEERFIDDPFCPGGRVYKTGDIGLWQEDGTILYLGRNDAQVKVRGNRVELGEIEAVVMACTSIKNCAAVVDRSTGSERIALFYAAELALSPDSLKKELGNQLPKYMIPELWIGMEKLPLTANGKIDRKALRLPSVLPQSNIAFKQPENETERRIYAIWKDALHLVDFDVEDNFFEIGGTSLTLASMFAVLNDAFPKKLNIADVFANPSVRALASFVRSREAAAQRVFIQGNLLRKECFGAGTDPLLKWKFDGTVGLDFRAQVSAAMAYGLSRFTPNCQINFSLFEENCCFSTVFCDMIDVDSLKKIVHRIKYTASDVSLEKLVRKPDRSACSCCLCIRSKQNMSRKDTERMSGLFDLVVDVLIEENRVELTLSNRMKTLRDPILKNLFKILCHLIEQMIS